MNFPLCCTVKALQNTCTCIRISFHFNEIQEYDTNKDRKTDTNTLTHNVSFNDTFRENGNGGFCVVGLRVNESE